jgi:hypothetical protein
MAACFARNVPTLSLVALFVAILSVLAVLAASATAQNPVPFIDQPLVPDATAPGGAGFTLTVNGAGFVASSTVNWNGSSRATTFISSAKLTATILASDIATSSSAAVTVVNPGPGGGASSPAYFEVTTPVVAVAFSRSKYRVDMGPSSVAVADFNGDGTLDLAVSNLYSNTVSVLLGKGDGTFGTKTDYPSGGGNFSVAAGDFNGDGKLDLAVTGGGVVSIFLGNGDGTFQPYVQYATGSGPVFVATGDFNRDGKLDLVTANNSSNESGTVSVLLGNGDGTFQAHVDYGAGVGPYCVAVGDFSGNGILDLAVANYADDTMSVLLGNGDGSFQPQVVYPTGGAISLAAGDFNGDGKLDLAVASNSSTVGIFLGNGDGTFQPQVNYAAGSILFAIVVGDFNGDGKLDLAVADYSRSVGLLLGNGDGTFQTHVEYPAGTAPESLAVGDFTGNGQLDLAVDNYNSNYSNVSVLLQTGRVPYKSTTVVTTSGSPSFVGQPVTFTATVTSIYGTIPNGETVTIYDNGTAIGAGRTASGVATFTTSSLTAKTHTIKATYAGDAKFWTSFGTVKQVVDKYTTTTALSSSLNPSDYGQAVTFTATIASAGPTPTGKVQFRDGTKLIRSVTLSGGIATLTTSNLAVGSHSITAEYLGDANSHKSTSSVLDQVVQ